jgi:methionyl-tRNA synthetase
LAAILYQCAEAVRIASLLLAPVLPFKMSVLWHALGLSPESSADLPGQLQWGGLKSGTAIKKIALFPRVEQTPAAAVAV